MAGRRTLLSERARSGLAVDGHGDLTADDVFCLPDGPRIIDCLDFDEKLRWVDVLDDIAFLAVDLEHLGRPDLAEQFLDWHEEFSSASAPASLRHHYQAYRAFVRAKVLAIRGAQGDATAASAADSWARSAEWHLAAGQVRLVLIGGAPGVGKSSVAGALADRLGSVLLATDTIRREQGIAPAARYSAAAKDATYRELLERASRALERGESVIADATWGDAAWRHAAREIGERTASRLVMLECLAPVELAAQRAEARHVNGTDASEAGQLSRPGSPATATRGRRRDRWTPRARSRPPSRRRWPPSPSADVGPAGFMT